MGGKSLFCLKCDCEEKLQRWVDIISDEKSDSEAGKVEEVDPHIKLQYAMHLSSIPESICTIFIQLQKKTSQ